MFSLEWRLWAFVITTLFLWVATGELGFAAAQAVGLHIALFLAHSLWYYARAEGANALTMDAAASALARYFYRALVGRKSR